MRVLRTMKLTPPRPFVSHLSSNIAFTIILAIMLVIVPSSCSSSCSSVNLSSDSPSPTSDTIFKCFETTGSNCPSGPRFSWTILYSLKSAERLIITGCQLKSVEVSEEQKESSAMLPELQDLRLNDNQLQDLPVGFMRNHMRLKIVHLQNNNLMILPRDFLGGCISMETLLLHNNKLAHLPSFIKLPLKVLTLHNNSLVCDCSLSILLQYKHTLLVTSSGAESEFLVCRNPAELNGQAIVNVSRDTVCREVPPYFSKLHLVAMASGVALFLVSTTVVLAGLCLCRSPSYDNRVSNNVPISYITSETSFNNQRGVHNTYIANTELTPPQAPEDVYQNLGRVGREYTAESDTYIDDDDDDKNDYQNL